MLNFSDSTFGAPLYQFDNCAVCLTDWHKSSRWSNDCGKETPLTGHTPPS